MNNPDALGNLKKRKLRKGVPEWSQMAKSTMSPGYESNPNRSIPSSRIAMYIPRRLIKWPKKVILQQICD